MRSRFARRATELDVDNSRWLVVPVREEVRVLCVAGREGAAKYVADALNPNPAGDSPIRPVIVSEGDWPKWSYPNSIACSCATWHSLRRTKRTGSRATRLRAEGSCSFSAIASLPENYNAPAPTATQSAAFPRGWRRCWSANRKFGLDPLEYRHPIVAPFRGRERAGLLTTPIARYYRLEVATRTARRSKSRRQCAAATHSSLPRRRSRPNRAGGHRRLARFGRCGDRRAVDAVADVAQLSADRSRAAGVRHRRAATSMATTRRHSAGEPGARRRLAPAPGRTANRAT